jgi:glutamate/tyrosine decarboxylase-like PLP-dependent enzyme
MRQQLLQLEQVSGQLEPAAAERKKVRDLVIEYTEDFLQRIAQLNAFNTFSGQAEPFHQLPVTDEPAAAEVLLQLLKEHVDFPGLNPASGGHLGYIPGGGLYYSALGDYLADVFNRYAGVFFGGPGAVRMENLLLRWIAGVMGYPPSSAGNLTSGGSIANLIAVVCARDSSKLKSRDYEKSVIYLTRQVHHSVDKAIRIAGLKEAIIRYVPMDDCYRMNAADLDHLITLDKMSRLHPLMVIASAGTTDTGAIDPLEKIGAVAKKHECWYHIDAAYGGFFILTDEGKEKLRGMELSDSLSVDPHKGLFLPYGTGAVLVKQKEILGQSHFYQAHYMQDAASAMEEISPADVSPELTKHFRGLRLWLPLMLHGLKPFRACLEEKLLLAKYFYQEVQKRGFEVGPEPELSVVTYRYVPAGRDANEFNKQLVEAVQKDGRVFISSTLLDGKFTLRAAILSFRTHLATVDLLLQVLEEKVKMLEAQKPNA